MTKITTNKSIPSGIRFCICSTTKDKRYAVIKAGNKLTLINDRPKIIEKTGLIPKASGTRAPAAKPPRLPIVSPICDT